MLSPMRTLSAIQFQVLLIITYIAYVYYEIKFIGIDTKAPSMIRLYICQNKDGKPVY